MSPKKRILIVDDEKDIVHLMRKKLMANGYEVYCAYDGQEALDRVKECHPEVILLDILMPVMDGWEVCRRLKENPETKGIPVVILSALNTDRPERILERSGACRLFVKPFDTQELITFLTEAPATHA